MYKHLSLILLIACILVGLQSTFQPFVWTFGCTASQTFVAKWGNHPEAKVVLMSGGIGNVLDTMKTCSTLGQGKMNADPWGCAGSVLASLASFYFAVVRYERTGEW